MFLLHTGRKLLYIFGVWTTWFFCQKNIIHADVITDKHSSRQMSAK